MGFLSVLGLTTAAYVFYLCAHQSISKRHVRLPKPSASVKVTAIKKTVEESSVTVLPAEASTIPAAKLIISCKGGLGNMMYQYASLYGLAKTNNMIPYFHCASGDLHDAFQLTIPRIEELPAELTEIGGGPCCIYMKNLTDLPPNKTYHLDEYLQSWKYFFNQFDAIRQQFRFSKTVQEWCDEEFETILKETDAGPSYFAVGIHARRGDFMNADNMDFGHAAAKDNFLNSAVNLARGKFAHLNKRLIFILAGDDFEWNKAHIASSSKEIYLLEPISATVDMCVLTKCNSVILSSGTYGWWSAFLANGRAWYEKDFCIPESALCQQMNENDFYLPTWNRLSADQDLNHVVSENQILRTAKRPLFYSSVKPTSKLR